MSVGKGDHQAFLIERLKAFPLNLLGLPYAISLLTFCQDINLLLVVSDMLIYDGVFLSS